MENNIISAIEDALFDDAKLDGLEKILMEAFQKEGIVWDANAVRAINLFVKRIILPDMMEQKSIETGLSHSVRMTIMGLSKIARRKSALEEKLNNLRNAGTSV